MEGIAGIIGGHDANLVDRMLRSLHHRGPAYSAVHADVSGILGARCGRNHHGPPLAESDGTAVASDSCLFNKEFLRGTIVPGTDSDASDAELFLRMYKTIGLRSFSYVDGAFVVAILDGKKTILARDPYGMKPLYISSGKGPLAYSSEMKSQMLSGSKFKPFSPGACLVSGEDVRRIIRTEIPWTDGKVLRTPEERLRDILSVSTANAIDHSKGLNILLSGGLDSSVVAAVAVKTTERRVATACVGTEDSEDLKMARKVADHLGTEHSEKVFDKEDLVDLVDEAVYWAESYDYPLIRSCLPNLIAVRLLKNKEYVTLVGEGCDELFAGYDFFKGVKNDAKLRKMRVDLLNNAHSTGFQRVDRISSSVSLDCRMPMMSDEMVSFALELGPKELFGPKRAFTKYIVRKAFEDQLPKEIAWRRKKKFSDGAGSMNLMAAEANRLVSDRRFESRSRFLGGDKVRTKEEMLYFEIFRRHFPVASAISSVGLTPL